MSLSVWNEFNRLQRDMDRMMGGLDPFYGGGAGNPTGFGLLLGAPPTTATASAADPSIANQGAITQSNQRGGNQLSLLGNNNAFMIPHTDVTETDNSFIVKADLPGVNKDEVKVSIKDDVISVSGERKEEKREDTDKYHRVERRFGSFQRQFRLPGTVNPEGITAVHENGVLTLNLPKKPEEKLGAKQIKIN